MKFLLLVSCFLVPLAFSQSSNSLVCDPSADRIGCGFIGFTREACIQDGCCWSQTPDPNPQYIPWYSNSILLNDSVHCFLFRFLIQ